MNIRYLTIIFFLFYLCLTGYTQETPKDSTSSPKDTTEYFDQNELIPTFSVNGDQLESETESQDISGVLQASRDVYTSVAGYNFSGARFKVRGYGSENFTVTMNGVPMNDPLTGWAVWRMWGGLNDITRYQEYNNAIGASKYVFGGAGGSSNISLRASDQRKGTKFSYAVSNRSYDHRVMLTHNTGLMKNGWSMSFSGSTRYAAEGYVEGTYYEAFSYFLSAEKKLSSNQSIGFSALGAPIEQGRSGIAIQEIYDLTSNNYYNPYLGYQNGEKRNSRIRNTHTPIFMLTHYLKLDTNSNLNTTAYFLTGKQSNTRLDWYSGQDPRPDYYKNLPSYYTGNDDPANASIYTDMWTASGPSPQIDFDHFYFANGKNLFTVKNANGETGNDVTGNRSMYVIQDQRQDPTRYGLNMVYNKKFSEKLKANGSFNYDKTKIHTYNKMDDLLGGDFWVDVNRFAERDFADPNLAQHDLQVPNRIVKEGDIYQFDLDMNINTLNLFGQLEYNLPKLENYLSLTLSNTTFWRTGYFQNGLFPDNSLGDSEKQSFFNYGAKLGTTYKINGRNYFNVNGMYLTKAPAVRDSYYNYPTRDYLIKGISNIEIISGDVNYILRYSKIKARLSAFYTEINNQVYNKMFYHEEYRTFITYLMNGVDHLYTGVELGLEAQLTPTVKLTGAFSKGNYTWNSRPTVTSLSGNTSDLIAPERTAYLKNYKLGGMPQMAATMGLEYRSAKYWYIGGNFNYFADMFIDINPDRRTEEAIATFVESDPQWKDVIEQTKLDNGYTLDLYAGKSFKVKKYFINFSLNVSNVLNNKDFVTGGFEQLRYDPVNIEKFPIKYSYMYGTTYFAMLSLRF